jgi:hypothetical protein
MQIAAPMDRPLSMMIFHERFDLIPKPRGEANMRRWHLLLPLAAALLLGCEKSSQTKVTTAPSNKDNQPPPIPDMSGKNKQPAKAE